VNEILKIQEKIINLIYPQTCGICGKINNKTICSKCNIQLKKQEKMGILTKEKLEENSLEMEKHFEELMYIFKYEGQIRELILDYKFNEKSYMYKTFVNFLLKNKKIFENIKKYDKIIPVPISKKRYKERGYNQSLLIAKEISMQISYETNNNIKLELVNNCLIKTKNIIEQSKLNKEDRQHNIQGVYTLKNGSILTNKSILLIDDIYTTGSTVNECSRVLQQAKPNKIGVLVLAKD
jgi:phosphoribosyltransferase